MDTQRRRVPSGVAARFALALLAAAVWFPAPPSAGDDLDDYVLARMESARVPGLSVCVVRRGEIALARGYGLANVKKKVPVTPDTVFLLASISKPFTATALMQLFEQGRFRLDDPVSPHLPFAASNPNRPGEPITFRQLLAHTSSIQDSGSMWSYLVAGDSPVPLGKYLKKYLRVQANYYPYGPGELYNYSNVGYALCGYLVESLSGLPFDAYCDELIFAPLRMDETSWFLKGLDKSHVAMPYKPSGKGYAPYGHWGFPYYPCGQLRTSAPQLARFLMAHMNGGEYGGARILGPDAAEAMRTVQFPALDPYYGLGFVRVAAADGTYIGHDGSLPGVRTMMFYQLEAGVGVILLGNGDVQDETAWGEIFLRLFEEAGAPASPDLLREIGAARTE